MTESVKLAGLGAPKSEPEGQAELPGVWRLSAARGAIEVKAFFRDKMAVAFIFGLPPILLVLLGSIFGSQAAAQGVTVGQLFTAGMIAGGITSTSFQYLAIGIATERENGMLKRLSGTPMRQDWCCARRHSAGSPAADRATDRGSRPVPRQAGSIVDEPAGTPTTRWSSPPAWPSAGPCSSARPR